MELKDEGGDEGNDEDSDDDDNEGCDEGWIIDFERLGVFGLWHTDKLIDICEYRVASETEKVLKLITN